jgi:hypothetical protein
LLPSCILSTLFSEGSVVLWLHILLLSATIWTQYKVHNYAVVIRINFEPMYSFRRRTSLKACNFRDSQLLNGLYF